MFGGFQANWKSKLLSNDLMTWHFTYNIVSRKISWRTNTDYMESSKQILQYINNTNYFTPKFKKRLNIKNVLRVMLNQIGDMILITKISKTGITIYHFGNLVTWTSKKQQVVALPTAKQYLTTEYLAVTHCETIIMYVKGCYNF